MAHLAAGGSIEKIHPLEMFGIDGQTGLDLEYIERPADRSEQVAFVAVGVPPEEIFPELQPVVVLFLHFGDYHVLEQTAQQLPVHFAVAAAGTQQKSQQARVVKIEFGCFHDALVEVLEIGRQLENEVTAFQNGEPLPCDVLGDAGFVGEVGIIEQLPCPSGAQGQKIAEHPEVFHLFQLAHVPLDVGLNIIVVKKRGVAAPVENGGIKTLHRRGGPGIRHDLGGVHFRKIKRQEPEQRHPARQALGDVLHQMEILRTGKDVLPHLAPVVHPPLDIGEQLGSLLRFVEDSPFRVSVEEADGVFNGKKAVVQIFQTDVGIAGKHFP